LESISIVAGLQQAARRKQQFDTITLKRGKEAMLLELKRDLFYFVNYSPFEK